ncbi:MAG: DMT family transporter, partial [Candidatus Krumholzibacteriia bacterium]
ESREVRMSKLRVYGALVLVQIFFGVHYFVAKLILELMTPRAWAAVRILGAATLLMLYNLLFLRRHPHGVRDFGRLALYAVFGVVCNQVLFVEGLSRTTPSHSSIINSLIPVITLAFALLLGHERPTPGRWGSIVVAFASVLVLLRVETFRIEDELIRGDLLTLANASSFSLFLVLSRGFLRRTDPMAATASLLAFGAVGIVGVGGGPLSGVWFGELPGRFWWLAAYAVVFPTALAYLLNYYALRDVDSSTVALFIYLQAPIATLLSVSFLAERPTPRFFACAAGIFLGVFLAVWERRPQQDRRRRA